MDYLEKYINVPIYFNNVEKYDDYINSLLADNKEINNGREVAQEEIASTRIEEILQDDKKFVFDIDEGATIKAILIEANKYIKITPRIIKKIINILIVSKQICILVNDKSQYAEKILFINYIKWFMFAYFNPKTSFNLQQGIKRKDYYYTIKMILNELDKKNDLYVEDEANAKAFVKYLYEIKVNEIKMFRNISNHFIPDEGNLIKYIKNN